MAFVCWDSTPWGTHPSKLPFALLSVRTVWGLIHYSRGQTSTEVKEAEGKETATPFIHWRSKESLLRSDEV